MLKHRYRPPRLFDLLGFRAFLSIVPCFLRNSPCRHLPTGIGNRDATATIYQDAANNAEQAETRETSERRQWTAVLLQALEDWKSPNQRLRSGAEKFFFESPEDFERPCRGAGLAADRVLTRLRGMKEAMPRRAVVSFLRAA